MSAEGRKNASDARIYTRTGDTGETGLFGGGRVAKDDVRVEAYGAVDELNAMLGVIAAGIEEPVMSERIALLQSDLFSLGAHLATPDPARVQQHLPPLPLERIEQMEQWMNAASAALPALRSFILPGGSPAGAQLHLARTVCRRAERRVVHLTRAEAVDPGVVRYLNRLSDLLFMLARVANQDAGVSELPWTPNPR